MEEIDFEKTKEDIEKLRDKLAPYQRPVLYACTIFLIVLIGFIGFAFGANMVCVQVEGFLDDSFSCHLDVYPNGTNKVQQSQQQMIAPQIIWPSQ